MNRITGTGLYRTIVVVFSLSFFAQAGLSLDKEEQLLSTYLWNDVKTLPSGKRPKIGLVLGGGGARGLAHIGVLKVLHREGVPIDLVVGTSVGALIGALYCSGLPVEQIQKMGEEIGWDRLTNISSAALVKLLVAQSLLSNKNLEQYLLKHIGHKQFSHMTTPFICIATDIQTGERIIFREGSVIQAVRASSTVPGLFKPVEYRHRFLVDGGLVDNIPTDIARLVGMDIVIAVSVEGSFTGYDTANVLQILNQALYIQGNVLSEKLLQQADFVIRPHVKDMSAIELWRSKECIEAGIAETRKGIFELKKLIMDRTFTQIIEPRRE